MNTINNSPDNDDILRTRYQRLQVDHHDFFKRHKYLSENINNITATESKNHLKKEKQLEALEERIRLLQSDKWLDKLFSIAKNHSEVEDIERLMQKWGQSTYDSVAHCIVDHANRHRFPGQYLKYLRKANRFNKKRSKKRISEPGVTRWKKHSGEYLIERDGKIVSYGLK